MSSEIDDLNRKTVIEDREYFSYSRDIDSRISKRVVTGKTLKDLYFLINSLGFLEGVSFNGWLVDEDDLTGFVTFRFFNDGLETLAVTLGYNADTDIGATVVPVSSTITDLFFVQGANFENEPIDSLQGLLFAVGGGVNTAFEIIQDVTDSFYIVDNSVFNKRLLTEGVYRLVIKAFAPNTQKIAAFNIVINTTAPIESINLSEFRVESSASVGTVVAGISTSGGKEPIVYTLLAQRISGTKTDVDIFEIDNVSDTLKTKNPVGVVGEVYDLFIQAQDSRTELPPEVEQFQIESVLSVFDNIYSISSNGIDEYFAAPSNVSLQPDELTFSGWIKLDSTAGGNRNLAAKWNAGTNEQSFIIRVDTVGLVRVFASDDGDNLQINQVSNGAPLTANTWHHIAVRIKENFCDIWINGAKRVNSDAFTFTTIHKNNSQLGILAGVEPSLSNLFDGLSDEFTIYNASISDAQILELYNGGAPVSPLTLSSSPNAISWWRHGDLLSGGNMPDNVGANTLSGANINNGNRSTDVPI